MKFGIVILAVLALGGLAYASDFAVVNSIYTCVNGMAAATNTEFNLTIVCPNPVNIQITRSPANSLQVINQNPEPNVTATFTINALSEINENITLAPNSIFTNSTYNITVRTGKEKEWNYNNTVNLTPDGNFILTNNTFNFSLKVIVPKLNITKSLTPPGNFIDTENGIAITTNYPLINENIALSFNQVYKNSTMNLTVTAPDAHALFTNFTLMESLYNGTVGDDCVQQAILKDGNGTIPICARTIGSNVSVFDLISSYDFAKQNFSIGIGQGILDMHAADNASAVAFHEQLVETINGINNDTSIKFCDTYPESGVCQEVAQQAQDIESQVTIEQGIYNLGAIVIGIFLCYLGLRWYQGQKIKEEQRKRVTK